jgi:hypothetical protein
MMYNIKKLYANNVLYHILYAVSYDDTITTHFHRRAEDLPRLEEGDARESHGPGQFYVNEWDPNGSQCGSTENDAAHTIESVTGGG